MLPWLLLTASWLAFAGMCLWISIASGLARHTLGQNLARLNDQDSVPHEEVRVLVHEARTTLWHYVDGPASIAALLALVVLVVLLVVLLVFFLHLRSDSRNSPQSPGERQS